MLANVPVGSRVAVVGEHAAVEEHVVARLPEGADGCLVRAVRIHAVLVREHRRGAAANPDVDAQVLDAGGAHVAQEIALDLLAEERVPVATFVERVEHRRSGDRPLQHRHVGED